MIHLIEEYPKGCKIDYRAIEAALNSPKIIPYIENNKIVKIVYVDKKLINIVTNE